MIDFSILINIVGLFVIMIVFTPFLLGVSQFITNTMRTHHIQSNIKCYYQMAAKTLQLGFTKKNDIWSFILFWIELTIVAFILSMLQFAREMENGLLMVMILVIILNLVSLLKIELANRSDKFLILGHFLVRFSSIIYVVLSIYMSLLIIYGVPDIYRIVELQKDIFYFGIPKWGIFLNPFSALLFSILIFLSSVRSISEQNIYHRDDHIFFEKCSEVIKLTCFIILFIYLFLGGPDKIDFFSSLVNQYPQLEILIQILLWLIKFIFLFGVFSFINYFLISLTSEIMGKIVMSWIIPLGAVTVLYSWIWNVYFDWI